MPKFLEFHCIPRQPMILIDEFHGPEFLPKKHNKSKPIQQRRNAKKQKRKKK